MESAGAGEKTMKLRYERTCCLCGNTLERNVLAVYERSTNTVRCIDCERTARAMLTDDEFILLTRTHPIRFAVERAEQNGTSLGEEYYAKDSHTYRHGWNEQVALRNAPTTSRTC